MRPADVLREALASLGARPGRTLLTMAGTILGVGALVATLGLAETASHQVSSRFDALRATEVRATTADDNHPDVMPDDFAERLGALNGVEAAGQFTQLGQVEINTTSNHAIGLTGRGDLVGLTPGTEEALRFELAEGSLFDTVHHDGKAKVAIVGAGVATRLNLPPLWVQPAVFVDGVALHVIGILEDAPTESRTDSWIMIPDSLGRSLVDIPAHPPVVVIQTKPGAAQTIAKQAPFALRPDAPEIISATAPPDPASLRLSVESDTTTAFLLVGAIALILGMLGIAVATFVAVLERIPEFGLRRAIGAHPRHIAALVLTESSITGSLGGALGAALGIITVVLFSANSGWTPILHPTAPALAIGLGAASGLLAGLGPSIRASRIEPIAALQRQA